MFNYANCRIAIGFCGGSCLRSPKTGWERQRGTCGLVRHVLVTDSSVPEGHLGLHSALYGDGSQGSDDAHRAADALERSNWPGRLDGSELLPLSSWLQAVSAAARPGATPRPVVGLYALYATDDEDARPWSVGASRCVNVDLAKIHKLGADPAPGKEPRFVRVRLVDAEPRMWTRARLEAVRHAWAEELAPSAEAELTTNPIHTHVAVEDVLSPDERKAFEEQTWKLKMAMGQNLADAGEGEDVSTAERRLNFLRAVEGDDWSAVIDTQTHATIPSKPREASPFAVRGSASSSATERIPRVLNVENVKAVLEALRPVLLADGGDLEVLGVSPEKGAVMIGLLGACTTCPAAPSTMESGIEKAIFDHFGRDVVKEVVRVDAGAAATSDHNLRLAIKSHLESLSDSLNREGATAVLADEDGFFEVQFTGSTMLFQLVQSSLTYRFPELSGRLRVTQMETA